MTLRQGQLSLAFLNCMDLGLMLLALGASIVVLYSPDAQVSVVEYTQDFLVTRIKLSNAILCAVLLIAWHLCFKAYGLYKSYRLRKIGDAIVDVAKAVSASSIALMIAAQVGGWKTITLFTVLVFCLTGIAFVSALRMTAYRVSQLFRRRGINTKSLLVNMLKILE